MLSLLPARILRFLEFIGFSGNRVWDLYLLFLIRLFPGKDLVYINHAFHTRSITIYVVNYYFSVFKKISRIDYAGVKAGMVISESLNLEQSRKTISLL